MQQARKKLGKKIQKLVDKHNQDKKDDRIYIGLDGNMSLDEFLRQLPLQKDMTGAVKMGTLFGQKLGIPFIEDVQVNITQ